MDRPSNGTYVTITSSSFSTVNEDTESPSLKLRKNIVAFRETTADAQRIVEVVDVFNELSKKTGGYVQLRPEFSYCPVLMGNDNQPVFLFQFVEVLDEMVDFSNIREELPTISFAQIDGAISFLRKLAQFNSKDFDIDNFADEELIQNERFLNELRQAFTHQETTRVLNLG